jgi:predicted small lipoprotein YifL
MKKLSSAFTLSILLCAVIGCGGKKPVAKWDEAKWDDSTWSYAPDAGPRKE